MKDIIISAILLSQHLIPNQMFSHAGSKFPHVLPEQEKPYFLVLIQSDINIDVRIRLYNSNLWTQRIVELQERDFSFSQKNKEK